MCVTAGCSNVFVFLQGTYVVSVPLPLPSLSGGFLMSTVFLGVQHWTFRSTLLDAGACFSILIPATLTWRDVNSFNF